jgi:hypothetical protein
VVILLHALDKEQRSSIELLIVTGLPPKRLFPRACGVRYHLTHGKGVIVKFKILFASVIVASIAAPLSAQAQGVPGGIAHGVYEGGRRAGPIGAVVGGAVGGVIGGIEGVLGVDYRAYATQPAPVVHHRTVHHRKVRHRRHHYSAR